VKRRWLPLILFLFSVVGLAAGLFVYVDRGRTRDELRNIDTYSRIQLQTLRKTIEKELVWAGERQLAIGKELASGVPIRLLKPEYTVGNNQSIEFVGNLSMNNLGAWTLDNLHANRSGGVGMASEKLMPQLVSVLPNKEIFELGSFFVAGIVDHERKFKVALAQRVSGKRVVLGLYDEYFFREIIDHQKGGIFDVGIFNHQGQSLGHTNGEYVGASFKNDPLVNLSMVNESDFGSAYFNNFRNQPVKGFFSKVAGSNLSVAVYFPLRYLDAQRGELKKQLFFGALALGFFGVSVFLIFGLPKGEYVEKNSLPNRLNEAAKSNQSYTEAAPDKRSLGGDVGEVGVVAAVPPGGVGDIPEVLDLPDSRLLNFDWVQIHDLVEEAVAKLQPILTQKGISIVVKYNEIPKIKLKRVAVTRALESVLKNSIEAMDYDRAGESEKQNGRHIEIEMSRDDSWAVLIIKDSGPGFKDKAKAFVPFYTTKGEAHSGLGLTGALRSVRESLGDLTVENDKNGIGALVKFRFPLGKNLGAWKAEEVFVLDGDVEVYQEELQAETEISVSKVFHHPVRIRRPGEKS
jgi:Histidine kinase-, DNA gyrase B-, and HSP90-like ATPase